MEIENDKMSITIKQPNPNSPAELIPYAGYIAGINHIELRGDLTRNSWKILTELGFSLYTCTLATPMLHNEARWFRWYVHPYKVSLSRRSSIMWLTDWLLNRLTSLYQILGPGKVKHQLLTSLATYVEQAVLEGTAVEYSTAAEAQSLLRTIRSELNDSEVNIRDWRLHLFPGIFRDLDRVITDGDLRVCGSLPNYIVDPLDRFPSELCYQWKAGEEYICSKTRLDPASFDINFSATMPNRFVRIIPWIGLFLALLGIVLGLKC